MSIHSGLFHQTADFSTDAATGSSSATPGMLRRIMSWYSAKAQAERDAAIAAFVEGRGGQLTDAMEREISQRFGGFAG